MKQRRENTIIGSGFTVTEARYSELLHVIGGKWPLQRLEGHPEKKTIARYNWLLVSTASCCSLQRLERQYVDMHYLPAIVEKDPAIANNHYNV